MIQTITPKDFADINRIVHRELEYRRRFYPSSSSWLFQVLKSYTDYIMALPPEDLMRTKYEQAVAKAHEEHSGIGGFLHDLWHGFVNLTFGLVKRSDFWGNKIAGTFNHLRATRTTFMMFNGFPISKVHDNDPDYKDRGATIWASLDKTDPTATAQYRELITPKKKMKSSKVLQTRSNNPKSGLYPYRWKLSTNLYDSHTDRFLNGRLVKAYLDFVKSLSSHLDDRLVLTCLDDYCLNGPYVWEQLVAKAKVNLATNKITVGENTYDILITPTFDISKDVVFIGSQNYEDNAKNFYIKKSESAPQDDPNGIYITADIDWKKSKGSIYQSNGTDTLIYKYTLENQQISNEMAQLIDSYRELLKWYNRVLKVRSVGYFGSDWIFDNPVPMCRGGFTQDHRDTGQWYAQWLLQHKGGNPYRNQHLVKEDDKLDPKGNLMKIKTTHNTSFNSDTWNDFFKMTWEDKRLLYAKYAPDGDKFSKMFAKYQYIMQNRDKGFYPSHSKHHMPNLETYSGHICTFIDMASEDYIDKKYSYEFWKDVYSKVAWDFSVDKRKITFENELFRHEIDFSAITTLEFEADLKQSKDHRWGYLVCRGNAFADGAVGDFKQEWWKPTGLYERAMRITDQGLVESDDVYPDDKWVVDGHWHESNSTNWVLFCKQFRGSKKVHAIAVQDININITDIQCSIGSEPKYTGLTSLWHILKVKEMDRWHKKNTPSRICKEEYIKNRQYYTATTYKSIALIPVNYALIRRSRFTFAERHKLYTETSYLFFSCYGFFSEKWQHGSWWKTQFLPFVLRIIGAALAYWTGGWSAVAVEVVIDILLEVVFKEEIKDFFASLVRKLGLTPTAGFLAQLVLILAQVALAYFGIPTYYPVTAFSTMTNALLNGLQIGLEQAFISSLTTGAMDNLKASREKLEKQFKNLIRTKEDIQRRLADSSSKIDPELLRQLIQQTETPNEFFARTLADDPTWIGSYKQLAELIPNDMRNFGSVAPEM